jgi:hypothetical protein
MSCIHSYVDIGARRKRVCAIRALDVAISNSCPIRQQLMSTAVGLKPVLPIFQALAWRIIHISLRIWTSIADKGCFWTSITDMFSAQLAARCGA